MNIYEIFFYFTLLKFIIQLNIQNENLIRIAEANKYKLSKCEIELS